MPSLARAARPCLHGDNVLLTLACSDDAGALLGFHQRNREHLKRWSPPAPDDFLTLGYWRRWAAASRTLYEQDRAARLVLRHVLLADGPIIGQINFSNVIRGAFQSAHVGYHIDAEVEGRGIMTEALRLAVGFAFSTLRLHRVQANYIPDNERSARLLERVGFEREGYARDYLFIDGSWRDHVLTALINPCASKPAPNGAGHGVRRD